MWWNTIDRHLSLFEASKNLLILPKYLETRLQSSMINFLLSIFPYFLISIKKNYTTVLKARQQQHRLLLLLLDMNRHCCMVKATSKYKQKKNILLNSN